MARTVLIDTGILILHLRNQQNMICFLRGLSRSDTVAISAITRTEIIAGTREHNRAATRKFISKFLVYPVTTIVADRAGELISLLRQNGRSIEVPDAIIAATALTQDILLVTLNRKHFEIVPNLRLYPIDLEDKS